MDLRSQVPEVVKAELRLRRARRRFPSANIQSSQVSLDARLGRRAGIGPDVVVSKGVSIGHYTYVNKGSLIISGTIGNFCSVAHYVHVGAQQHPARHLSTAPAMYGPESLTGSPSGFEELPSPPVIGSDVWIGTAAQIMQGVTVGHGAIIAAGAVLKIGETVRPYEIFGGVPARRIGDRFPAHVVARLLELQWWDLPDAELRHIGPFVAAGDDWPSLLL